MGAWSEPVQSNRGDVPCSDRTEEEREVIGGAEGGVDEHVSDPIIHKPLLKFL